MFSLLLGSLNFVILLYLLITRMNMANKGTKDFQLLFCCLFHKKIPFWDEFSGLPDEEYFFFGW
ncbi:hypothetical protein DEHRE_00485 [Dehalobacter restrictus DSM 9455]|uniref:Uncharacterized protein n=1 Tax=Dehalobacter restrictus (strain DSM 9455 / PER-K23) TaxID=871738 RepID=A0ABN4BZL5_DEHRP|nr:hypothetical protein DEHRE_00485 [Dehalobacter restrictus DSM 9455]